MRFKARVEVKLKPGLTDAEGLTTLESLKDLGFNTIDVRVGKVYYITLEALDVKDAERQVDLMCIRLLANPEVKDDYEYAIEPEGG